MNLDFIQDAEGNLINLDPRIREMFALIFEAQDKIQNMRQGWLEIHFDGPKVHARLKQHIGVRKCSNGKWRTP